MRILYFGTLGRLSSLPFHRLLQTEMSICGLVMPAEIIPPFALEDEGQADAPLRTIRKQLPTPNLLADRSSSSLTHAARHNVPAFAVREMAAPETAAALNALSPDIICVSCFPHLLSPEILSLPRLGCLNVHPSLLPRFRGPAPIFWTLRAGESQTGVTVHWMDEQFDTGEIFLQRPFSLQDGALHEDIETALAALGAELLVEAITELAAGKLTRIPQPPGYSSDPWPEEADFVLETSWPARRAFNFMRGTMNWARPYAVTIDQRLFWLDTAVAFDPLARLPAPVIIQENLLKIQFSPGTLTAVPARQ